MKIESMRKKMEGFMNRKEFLKSLRKELAFLEKEELEKEVLYYINKIDSTKESDFEIIKTFGTMEDITKEVCKRHGLNYKTIKEEKQNWFKNFYTNLIELSTILKNSDGKKRSKIILDILLLIVVTCVLKIPFIFIRDLGDRAIETILESNITILALWGLMIEIVYVVIALTFFIKTFERWFKELAKEEKEK